MSPKKIIVGRLTLDRTWELCLLMWKWIAEQRKLHPTFPVPDLKDRWCHKHGVTMLARYSNCFFCKRAGRGLDNDYSCKNCPGVKVSPDFNCMDEGVNYEYSPIEFYHKLVELSAKRLSKKGNR